MYKRSFGNFFSFFILYILVFQFLTIYSQPSDLIEATNTLTERGEVYFRFPCSSCNLETLTKLVSIDNYNEGKVYAYANHEEFNAFLDLGIEFEILTPPSLKLPNELDKSGSLKDWNSYPSYSEYVLMMNTFAADYPDLCELVEIERTVEGRSLLAVKLSDNVRQKEAEPEFLFTSTIHGDEVTGYMLTLRLIDYLLVNYESDEHVQQLLDTIEIWINPNANPDGTYHAGNSSVSGATRYNANNIDLNRNFKDPEDGDHPDVNDWQPETIAMMNFMDAHRFVFSANYHGGAEVMNYPWDTWSRMHPDEDWFVKVSKQYADTVKKQAGSSYFSDITPSGVTNGYAWYPVAGSRQDYMTYFAHGREITIEVSSTKMPLAETMPDYWNYNRQAMLEYIGQCKYGIHGIVTDSITKSPLPALVEILDFDNDSSQVYTDPANGDFHRLIQPGNYNLKFSCPGYKEKIIEDVLVDSYTSTLWIDVDMAHEKTKSDGILEKYSESLNVYYDGNHQLLIDLTENGFIHILIYNMNGQLVFQSEKLFQTKGSLVFALPVNLPPGVYLSKIIFNNGMVQSIRFSINQ